MLRKVLPLLLAGSILLYGGCGNHTADSSKDSASSGSAQPEADRSETVGVWFSYLEYKGYCSEMDEEEFTAYVQNAVSNMNDLGINTLYLHAVAFTDAIYDSAIYPRASYMSNTDYDPYAIFAAEAEKNGIAVHAWINPMRSVKVDEVQSLPEDFIIRRWIAKNDERVRQVGDRYYLNPAYPEVRQLICSVVSELMEKYHPAGIHMDDYFYPYETAKNFDAYIYSTAQEENPSLTLEEFRTANVDEMVKELHDTVKAFDADMEFGISPAGNIDNCISLLFGNPYHWVEQGTVDYLIPQIYWGYLHPVKPFEPTWQEWLQVKGSSDVRLMAGLAAYVIGARVSVSSDNEEANLEWVNHDDMMARQMETVFTQGGDGVVFFSYSSLFSPDEETTEIVENEILHIKNQLNR